MVAGRDKQPRRLRREVVNRFEQGFDFGRLDYDRRVKPLRGKAIIYGILVAAAVYLAGFSLGYYGWQRQAVDYALFARLVWVLMVPATVIGALVWLIAMNRLEYPIREDIRRYISEREVDAGYLWRFEPLFRLLLSDNKTVKRLLLQVQEGVTEIDPGDYARSLFLLRERLQQDSRNTLSTEVATQVYNNLVDAGPG